MYRNLASYTKRDPATGKRQTYVWEATWDENGNRVEIETPVNPYFYVEDISTGKDSITNTISVRAVVLAGKLIQRHLGQVV